MESFFGRERPVLAVVDWESRGVVEAIRDERCEEKAREVDEGISLPVEDFFGRGMPYSEESLVGITAKCCIQLSFMHEINGREEKA